MSNRLADAQRRFARAVAQQHNVSKSPVGVQTSCLYRSALFVSVESFDTNLSHITIGGVDVRAVARTAGAWTSHPAAGTVLAVLETGAGAYLILGAILGDPTLSPRLGAGG